MNAVISRRRLIGAGLVLPMFALPGCLAGIGGFDFAEAVRRLLTISSQRAFAGLLRDNGFFADEVARVTLPPELGGSGSTSIVAALLQTPAIQERLLVQVNRAAETAARAATPVVMNSIRSMRFTDALAIARGGNTAATDYLQESMGPALFNVLFPGVANGLRLFDNAIVTQALRAATGIDFTGLQHDISRKASDGIYRAISREEAAIRADPRATGDPLLIGVFGVLPYDSDEYRPSPGAYRT